MALISLLLALLIERVVHLSAKLQLDSVLQRYLFPLLPSFINAGLFGTLVIITLPAILMYSLLDALAGLYYGIFTTLTWLVLLLMSFGGSDYRRDYRSYLKALSRNDLQAKGMYADCLNVNSAHFCPSALTAAVAKQLVWMNYRFYFAVIFYFVLLGPVGLMFYVAARSYHKFIIQYPQASTPATACCHPNAAIHRIMRVIDWIPTRLTMLGYALVAEEQTALPKALRSWLDVSTSECELLGQVVYVGSQANVATDKCYDYTCYLVQLAKRNIVLFMTIISMFTLGGVIV
jgi:AmpE protein